MKRPLLLDLFCGAGGAGMGYHLAGFDVIGVDLKPQPRYPFPFVQADALEFLQSARLGGFDLIHASPPCQQYSVTRSIHGRSYPDLLPAVRELLQGSGRPWVIENVPGSPMHHPVVLCGTMFGLKVYRHRWFDCSALLLAPRCLGHPQIAVAVGLPAGEDDVMTVAGHFSGVAMARRAMGIDWMGRAELAQAIPPAYTFWVGSQMKNTF